MHYNLKINKQEVFDKVELLASYQAAKNSAETFDNAHVKDADKEIIDSYFAESCNILTQLLIKYINNDCHVLHDADFTLHLHLANYPEQLTDSLRSLCVDIMAYNALTRWLLMVNSKTAPSSIDETAVAGDKYTSCVEQLKHLLNTRNHPVRLRQQPW